MNAVIEHNTTGVVEKQTAPITPMEMLDRAVSSGASVETLERLMNLQERWEANQARKAFDDAMAAAKAEIPTINKNRMVDFTGKTGVRTHYRHEDLGEIARTVDPILAKHGLSYRFRTASPVGEPVTVTCVISHRDGHSEENTLVGPRDESGNKNAIQSIGSTLSFLQRYTLKAGLGLAASYDDDGKKSDDDPISQDQVKVIRDLIDATGSDIAKFCKYIGVESIPEIQASAFKRAVAVLENKKGGGK
jgi:hypothetical protein